MKKALSITTSLQQKVKFNKITCNQKKSTVNNRKSTTQQNLVFKSSQDDNCYLLHGNVFLMNFEKNYVCLQDCSPITGTFQYFLPFIST